MKGWVAHAEWRRLHWEASWFLSGVYVDQRFWPAGSERPATVREYEAGNVEWTRLPTVIAVRADVAAGIALAGLGVGPRAGDGVPAVIRRPTGSGGH